ncbi:MAG: hypothetical protein LBN33_06725 [Desulfovibrio sp.]|jgi:hypothetical protein|nr:hypothetical protein [Desulfovibrio sp.]
MSAQNDSLSAFLALLQDLHKEICDLEKKALDALTCAQDEKSYRTLMAERAQRIASLAEAGAELRPDLPEKMRLKAEAELALFSAGARQALNLGSVFYMSALLYPDDHKTGEADNLQKLITRLKRDAQ